MTKNPDGSFPDLPGIPSLPHLRPQNSTADQVLREARSILRSASDATHRIECCAPPGDHLRLIRGVIVDMRRSTFVLQKLRSRVDGFDAWYEGVQAVLREDALMRYFGHLRNEVEKEGFPGVIAELYFVDTGEALADVACFEDEHGLAVSGAARPGVGIPSGQIDRPTALRNFRLPDPPKTHRATS